MFSHRLVPCQERSQMGFTGGVQGSDWLWGSSPPASPFARGEGCRGAGAAATKCGPNRSRLSTRGLLGISRGACPRPLPFLCLPPELCGCGTPHKACQPPRGQAGRELPARARHPAAATGLPDPRGSSESKRCPRANSSGRLWFVSELPVEKTKQLEVPAAGGWHGRVGGPSRGEAAAPHGRGQLGAERRQLSSRAEHCSVLLPPPFCCLELLPGRVKLCSLPEPAAPLWVHIEHTRRCRPPRCARRWDPSCLGHPGLLLLSAATGRGTLLCHGPVAAWPEALASGVRAAGGAVAAGCRAAVSGADVLPGVGFGVGAPPAQHGVVQVAASPRLLSAAARGSVRLSW